MRGYAGYTDASREEKEEEVLGEDAFPLVENGKDECQDLALDASFVAHRELAVFLIPTYIYTKFLYIDTRIEIVLIENGTPACASS